MVRMGEGMTTYAEITQKREKARPPYPKRGVQEFELRVEEGLPDLMGYGVTIRGGGAA